MEKIILNHDVKNILPCPICNEIPEIIFTPLLVYSKPITTEDSVFTHSVIKYFCRCKNDRRMTAYYDSREEAIYN